MSGPLRRSVRPDSRDNAGGGARPPSMCKEPATMSKQSISHQQQQADTHNSEPTESKSEPQCSTKIPHSPSLAEAVGYFNPAKFEAESKQALVRKTAFQPRPPPPAPLYISISLSSLYRESISPFSNRCRMACALKTS